jgi:hypothetical protein
MDMHTATDLTISAEELAHHCAAGNWILEHARDHDASEEQCRTISRVLHHLKVEVIWDCWTLSTTSLVPLLEEGSREVEDICCIGEDDAWEATALGQIVMDKMVVVVDWD